MKKDTLAQLKEFGAFLARLQEGHMSLLPAIAHAKLAMKKAVAKAFQAKEVVGYFEAQEPIALRG